MILKIDNRPNRNKNRYIALGIILGIAITVGGFYAYGNYQSAINQNVNPIKNTLDQITHTTSQYVPYIPKYGASSHYEPSTDIITLTVVGASNGFSYNVTMIDYTKTVKHQYIETAKTSTDIRSFSLSDVCKPAEVIVSIPDVGQIYSAYEGTFEQAQACQK